MKKITRTVITHSITFAEVNGTNLEMFEVREMAEAPVFVCALKRKKETGGSSIRCTNRKEIFYDR